MKRIAILGGGYAGMAAAVELADAGCAVTVFEAGKVLGGRARQVALDGKSLDNGQHLVIGAYAELLRLQQKVGVDLSVAYLRQPLSLRVEPKFRLRCRNLPAPLHLLLGVLTARGINWLERLRLMRAMRAAEVSGWRLAQDVPVAIWLASQGQNARLIARFWRPLVLAALNTPLEKASTQILFNVLRDSLAGSREASELLFPRVDFSALFPDAAAAFIKIRSGEVRFGTMVKQLTQTDAGWQVNDGEQRFTAVICALPPHRAGMALKSLPALAATVNVLENWAYQPIVTVYLQYLAQVRLDEPMLGLADSVAQWVFDRGQTHNMPGLLAVVISAEGEHESWSRDDLATRVAAELHTRLGVPAQPEWSSVIAEKLATFACVPGMTRPANATPLAGLWLAGDYTAGVPYDYPATLEGAVRSGVAAAQGVLHRLGRR